MKKIQIGALGGILFPVLIMILIPITQKYTDDLTSTDASYVAKLIEHTHTIQYVAGLGFLSVVLLLMHLEWLTGLVSKHAPFSAKVAKSCGQIAAIGVALSYGLILLATYGAGQKWPDQIIRTTGLLNNLGGVTFTGLAAFAGVIAYLGWNGKFPKWIAALATLEVVIAVIATGVGAQGVAFLPTTAWLFINAIGLLFHERKIS